MVPLNRFDHEKMHVMKNIYRALGLVVSLLVLVSCKKEEEGSLAIHFKPLYDGQPLVTFVTQPFDNGQQIQLNHMSIMISDSRLYKGSSEEDLDEVEIVDMSFDNLQDATDGYTLTVDHIPAGSYDGIRFGIGLTPDVNAKHPSDFPSSHPLSKNGYYWTLWDSYIFMKTEGHLDTLGNGTFDLGFALHTGSDELYRSLDGPIPLTIEDGKETELNIYFDYRKLLEGLDIKAKPQNHNPADTLLIYPMMDNLTSNNVITLSH